MPITNNNNEKVVTAAREGLRKWYAKQGLKDADLDKRVDHVMAVQFCTNTTNGAALDSLAEME